MLPEIRKPLRWRSGGISNLAVPSEEFERIDIVHVTEDGRVHAPTANGMMPSTVEGLLDAWLNVHKGDGISFVRALQSTTVEAPYLNRANEISWRERTVAFGPEAYMPVSSLNAEAREVVLKWPPEGSLPPVSPEAESAQRFLSVSNYNSVGSWRLK